MELLSALEQPCSPGRVLSAFHSFAFSSLLTGHLAVQEQQRKLQHLMPSSYADILVAVSAAVLAAQPQIWAREEREAAASAAAAAAALVLVVEVEALAVQGRCRRLDLKNRSFVGNRSEPTTQSD